MDTENEKTPLRESVDDTETQSPPPRPSPQSRFVHRRLPAVLLLLVLWTTFRAAFVYKHQYCPHKTLRPQWSSDESGALDGNKRIPLEAHIMSKCPDAKDCLQLLVVPTMVNISDKVDFRLSYIGKVDTQSDEVTCMHGPGECLGNIIQLCAATAYPDPKQYLGFTNCMSFDYKDIPDRDLVESCAMEYGLDFDKLNDCISDEGGGMDLLRSSAERSRDLGVTKSCTIRLADKVRCIRDGGKWSDCEGGSKVEDLVADIEELYQQYN